MTEAHVISLVDEITPGARWLFEQNPVPPHVVYFIKTKFELSALQACEACRAAQDIRAGKGNING